MNRLVIIGNGFDLAHGLPTGYCDFIDWYWRKVDNTDYKDDFIYFESEEKISFIADNLNNIILKLKIAYPKDTIYNNDQGYHILREGRTGDIISDDVIIHLLQFKNQFLVQ